MKKKNKKSKGWFEDRRVALLVALILAVLSWILVAGFINPGDTRRLTPITIDYSRNADMYEARNLRIVGEPTPRYAEVQVSGDGSVIGPLTTTSVTVYPDYSAVTGPGPQELRLLYEKVDFGDYNITEVSAIATGYSLDSNPKHTVTLVFEELETKEFPIAVKADNVTAADGFFRDTPTADPARVTIDGAKTELDRIAQVVAVLEDDVELTETTSYQDVPLTLMDSAGNVLDTAAMNLNFSITSTTVTVPIMVSKSIQLTATFIGLPSYFDTDWFYERVQLTPDTLQVVGSASAFEHIGDTVSVATFDASTLTPGWQSEPQEIELPEGSGLSYHNLARMGPEAAVPSREFDDWLAETLMSPPAERTERLRRWDEAPSARIAHPTEDHLIPLMVVVGAAEDEPAARTYHQDDFFGFVSASSYRFGAPVPATAGV